MGLDSVELVVAFEKYFGLDIPNRMAEQLLTVADAAHAITGLKNLSTNPARTVAYDELLLRLLRCLQTLQPLVTKATLLPELGLLGSSTKQQVTLATCLQLQLPDLFQTRWLSSSPGWWQRLFNTTSTAALTPPYPNWGQSTVADLAEWLLAQNYARLLPQPATLYEVQRIVVGITSHQCGIPVPEIRLADSFTYDLGVD
ncbi:hypothetical protein ACFPAF_02510 [Hymenobacter endophyticus]|uniref:Carrier domain-containing protein n=1 Tax=Hymenobacter endophyticus TaxID=3076335 RepID=A0ABU3TD38_9BACT|nr:hypothetical protein [Hymenobacter endophyticus]MDU0369254.1 hypothetical protein [Hymenobacter endophyticus]